MPAAPRKLETHFSAGFQAAECYGHQLSGLVGCGVRRWGLDSYPRSPIQEGQEREAGGDLGVVLPILEVPQSLWAGSPTPSEGTCPGPDPHTLPHLSLPEEEWQCQGYVGGAQGWIPHACLNK